jgi:hypothetical protein
MLIKGIDIDDDMHMKAVDKLAHFGFIYQAVARDAKKRIIYSFRCNGGHRHWCYMYITLLWDTDYHFNPAAICQSLNVNNFY